MSDTNPVIVVGAGIVGTATARSLQRAGHAVTLLDSAEPGRATSYGNAGFIAIDHLLPLARPSTLKRLPKMLTDRDGPLTVHGPSIPALLPWMARFALAAYSNAEVRKGIDSFGVLMAEANLAWIPLDSLDQITLSGPHRRWINRILAERLRASAQPPASSLGAAMPTRRRAQDAG